LPRSGTIEGRWLMQSNEGVSIVPMAARHVMPIDDDDRGVGIGEQLVGMPRAPAPTIR
jgi:hypothetical protein